MKRRIVLIVFVLFIIKEASAGLFGSFSKSGTTAAQFLKIQVGARAAGMGGAYVALANDISSIYWNPAGLAMIKGAGAVNFVYSDWLADTQFNFAAAAINAGGFGTIGISFTALTMPDMEVRSEFEPEGTGEFFSAGDMAIGISYARSLTDRFIIGLNAKYIRQQIWHMTASTLAFDIGLLFRTDADWLVMGICISNFGSKLQYTGNDVFINYDFTDDEFGDSKNIFANLQTDYWNLPLMFRFGLSADIINEETNSLITAVELRSPNDNTESISFGLEYGFMRRFFLRTGYQSLFEQDSEKGLTAGAGFVYFLSPAMPLKFDYAYADWNRLMSVHRFSIEIQF